MLTDLEHIDAARRGDLAGFEALVVKYQARVFGIARRYSRSESDAQDIVQDVFIKAFQKLGGFRAEAPFEHWLMRLTVRVCYDYLRVRQRQREVVLTDLSEAECRWLEGFATAPETADPTAGEARELLDKVLAKLSPPSRLVIQLLELEERSIKEIASLTGWSIPSVKVKAFRARREMRRHLDALLATRAL